jgi:hypothetical protein
MRLLLTKALAPALPAIRGLAAVGCHSRHNAALAVATNVSEIDQQTLPMLFHIM